MREVLPPLPMPHEHAPILYTAQQVWHCDRCDPDGTGSVAAHTVVWRGQNLPGPVGRCASCGQRYEAVGNMAPTIAEQMARWPKKFRDPA